MLRPFFSYYGSKWSAAPRYPSPRYGLIIEPFAGSAGYSLRYSSKSVHLYDVDPCIVGVWQYLIRTSSAEIKRLPLLQPGQPVSNLNVCPEAAALIGFWCNRGNARPGKSLGHWGQERHRRQFWGLYARQRIAQQVDQIRHWQVTQLSYARIPDRQASWYVDPPYIDKGKHYRHGCSGIDYQHLAGWCKSRSGQVMVCEQAGAAWLPFQPFASIKATRGTSKEVLWVQDQPQQLQLFA